MDIFIGYKSEDRERVHALAAALSDVGYSVFWDQHIPPGSTWRQTIGKALEEAKLVIICWSKATIDSEAAKWVLDEADEAMRTKKPIIPIKLDDVAPPMGHRQLQALDLTAWSGDKRDAAFAELQVAIAGALQGKMRSGGSVAHIKQRRGKAPFWIIAILATAGIAFVGGLVLPRVLGLTDTIAGKETGAKYVDPYDTRLLDARVAPAVQKMRRSIKLEPGGELMDGRAFGAAKWQADKDIVCIDFADGSMFEGEAVRIPGGKPGGDLRSPSLAGMYSITGVGVMWHPKGFVEWQGRWQDGRPVEAYPISNEFEVGDVAYARSNSIEANTGDESGSIEDLMSEGVFNYGHSGCISLPGRMPSGRARAVPESAVLDPPDTKAVGAPEIDPLAANGDTEQQ